jgi:hypothetical protein
LWSKDHKTRLASSHLNCLVLPWGCPRVCANTPLVFPTRFGCTFTSSPLVCRELWKTGLSLIIIPHPTVGREWSAVSARKSTSSCFFFNSSIHCIRLATVALLFVPNHLHHCLNPCSRLITCAVLACYYLSLLVLLVYILIWFGTHR